MRNLIFALFFVSATAFAGGLGSFLKEVVNTVVQDIDTQQGGGEKTQVLSPSPATALSSAQERYERIVTAMDCRGQLGWNRSVQSMQTCDQKHFDQCLTLLESLPLNEDGLRNLSEMFGDQGKCQITGVAGDRTKYIAAENAKRSKICVSLLDEVPLERDIEELSWRDECGRSKEFNVKIRERSEQVLKIQKEKKKVAREQSAIANAGLIEKYKKIVPAPPQLLLADIVVQWGASNFGPLIKFIDMVQNNSRSKAKYEMAGESLVMRHRITDPVTGKSSNLIYVFTPSRELPPGEILLTRIVAEESSLGGLSKKHEEVDVTQIATVFALVYAGMTTEKSK